ncbi:MAG: hypothetical protein CSB01_01280 [Bacteroidia bacterium]|nr:MAG: hypothetical protein CSB01_01280 [Bacteroidia bacterium]
MYQKAEIMYGLTPLTMINIGRIIVILKLIIIPKQQKFLLEDLVIRNGLHAMAQAIKTHVIILQ